MICTKGSLHVINSICKWMTLWSKLLVSYKHCVPCLSKFRQTLIENSSVDWIYKLLDNWWQLFVMTYNKLNMLAGCNVLLLEGDITSSLVVSATDYLDFLEKEVLPFPLDARNQRHKKKILLKLARDLKVLPPPNPSIADLDFDISQWRHIIRELVKKMRIVESQCSMEIRNFGVYILTSTPYNAFLEMLATHIPG